MNPVFFDDAEFNLQTVNDRFDGLFLIRMVRVKRRQPGRIINARDDKLISLRLRVNGVATK